MSNRTSLNVHATEKVQDAYMTRGAAEASKHLCNKLPDRIEEKKELRCVFILLSSGWCAVLWTRVSNSRSSCRQIGGGRPEGQ